MSKGSLTLGGNMSVAVGPLGRNAEGSGAINTKGKAAMMYSYSRTRGLFGGVRRRSFTRADCRRSVSKVASSSSDQTRTRKPTAAT